MKNKLGDLVSLLNSKDKFITVYNSFDNLCVLEILDKEGYIKIEKLTKENYLDNKINIEKLTREFKIDQISKLSRKIYREKKELKLDYKNGLGLYLIRTSKGIMTVNSAYDNNLGGEIILRII